MRFFVFIVILLSISSSAFSQKKEIDLRDYPLYNFDSRNCPISYDDKTSKKTYFPDTNTDISTAYFIFNDSWLQKEEVESSKTDSITYYNVYNIRYLEQESSYKKILLNYIQTEPTSAPSVCPISKLLNLAQLKIMIGSLHANCSAENKDLEYINKQYDKYEKSFPDKLKEFNKTIKTDSDTKIIEDINNQIEKCINNYKKVHKIQE